MIVSYPQSLFFTPSGSQQRIITQYSAARAAVCSNLPNFFLCTFPLSPHTAQATAVYNIIQRKNNTTKLLLSNVNSACRYWKQTALCVPWASLSGSHLARALRANIFPFFSYPKWLVISTTDIKADLLERKRNQKCRYM